MKLKSSLNSKIKKIVTKSSIISASIISGLTLSLGSLVQVWALTLNPTPAAKVSFTFDDGLTSSLTQAAPTLAKYGMTATNYVSTGCVGMTTAPNSCPADPDVTYLSWSQVNQLKDTYGWEIASHTVSHPYMASTDPDEQPVKLTPAEVTQQLTQSKADLAAHGINAQAYASPYGDYDMPVLAEIAKYYSSQRGFADTGYNVWPNSDYLIRVQQVQNPVSVNQVKAYIDSAIANKQWLVLVFHDIRVRASRNPDDYQYSTANLDAIAAYIKSKNMPVVNISDGLIKSDQNLLPNSTFNNGIADGWTTDKPANIVADSAEHGSFPDYAKSVKLTSSTSNGHLFSPKVSVNSSTNYMIKSFLNVSALNSGEVGYYIDEYDAFGNWISGQFKKAEPSVFVESMNFAYKPTSNAVTKASLQVYVTANSGITAYVDNFQWFALDSAPPVVQNNLMPNSNFDLGVGGGWATDRPVLITANNTNNGSPANPVNSVRMASGTTNGHLFSPRITVDPTKTHTLTNYINIQSISSGEVGFYLDEYDAVGNWISGQYKMGVGVVGAGNVQFSYKPTSTNVTRASLQVIVKANSGLIAYFDDSQWLN